MADDYERQRKITREPRKKRAEGVLGRIRGRLVCPDRHLRQGFGESRG